MKQTDKLLKHKKDEVFKLISPHLNGLIKKLQKSYYRPEDLNDVIVYFDKTTGDIFASAFNLKFEHLVYCLKENKLVKSNQLNDNHLNLFTINLNNNNIGNANKKDLKPFNKTWNGFYRKLDFFDASYHDDKESLLITLYDLNLNKIRSNKIDEILQ